MADTGQPTFFQAVARGFCKRCPKCGEGKLFGHYLKVVDRCASCGEEYFHHRADDFPAYVVIVIVGHIVVTLAVWVATHFHLSAGAQMAIWIPVTLILALLLLAPIKGAIVAIQWHGGMHGFAAAKTLREKAGG